MKASRPTHPRNATASLPSATRDEWLSPRAFWIAAFVLMVCVIAIYSPALNFQFVLDDHRFIGDPRVQSAGYVWEYFTSYVWAQVSGGPSSFYRPLFVLWLRLNFILSEMSPWGWHLLSIAKHLSVAILLGLLVWKLLKNQTVALVAGTLFALHPAHTESVAWVTVPDPLMCIALIVGLLLYMEHEDRLSAGGHLGRERILRKSGKRRRNGLKTRPSAVWLMGSALAFFVVLLVKVTIVWSVVMLATILIVPYERLHERVSDPG